MAAQAAARLRAQVQNATVRPTRPRTRHRAAGRGHACRRDHRIRAPCVHRTGAVVRPGGRASRRRRARSGGGTAPRDHRSVPARPPVRLARGDGGAIRRLGRRREGVRAVGEPPPSERLRWVAVRHVGHEQPVPHARRRPQRAAHRRRRPGCRGDAAPRRARRAPHGGAGGGHPDRDRWGSGSARHGSGDLPPRPPGRRAALRRAGDSRAGGVGLHAGAALAGRGARSGRALGRAEPRRGARLQPRPRVWPGRGVRALGPDEHPAGVRVVLRRGCRDQLVRHELDGVVERGAGRAGVLRDLSGQERAEPRQDPARDLTGGRAHPLVRGVPLRLLSRRYDALLDPRARRVLAGLRRHGDDPPPVAEPAPRLRLGEGDGRRRRRLDGQCAGRSGGDRGRGPSAGAQVRRVHGGGVGEGPRSVSPDGAGDARTPGGRRGASPARARARHATRQAVAFRRASLRVRAPRWRQAVGRADGVAGDRPGVRPVRRAPRSGDGSGARGRGNHDRLGCAHPRAVVATVRSAALQQRNRVAVRHRVRRAGAVPLPQRGDGVGGDVRGRAHRVSVGSGGQPRGALGQRVRAARDRRTTTVLRDLDAADAAGARAPGLGG